MRVELTVEYDGTRYAGYQRQNNAYTVQQALEEAYFALTRERVTMTAAGRTDAGVSAAAQRVHFDTEARIPAERICFAMNTRLPVDIRVQASREHDGFHARYDARGKHYRYTIVNRRHGSALLAARSWHIPQPLDTAAMKAAAEQFAGEHDFAAFCAAGAQTKTTVRTIYGVEICDKDGIINIDVTGNGFLYNMVRIIAGTLADVGKGKTASSDIADIIASRDRTRAGETAPPQGLTLMEVYYESDAKDNP